MKYWHRKAARLWLRTRRFAVHNIFHADDPPHRLALGIAVGLFVTFTPTIGAQMVLVVFLSWLLGANKIVGLPIVWLSNPATFVPIYYPSYLVGLRILKAPRKGEAWWQELRQPPEAADEVIPFYWRKMLDIIEPLALGSIFVATLVAVAGYYASRRLIGVYRMRRFGQLIPPADHKPPRRLWRRRAP